MFKHGKNTVFKIDNSAAALQDISAYATNVDHPDTHEGSETTTFGKARKTRIPGLGDRTISVQGNWDPALDAIMGGIVGLVGSYEYGPGGSTAGDPKYSGEVLCTNYTVNSPVNGVVTWSATFEEADGSTRGVWP